MKKNENAEKTEREERLELSTLIMSQNSRKIEGAPFGGEKFRKKSRTMPQKN